MNILSEAIRYKWELGFSVIPLAPRAKRPPRGFRLKPFLDGHAEASEEQLGEWFGLGNHNLAAVLGGPSHNLCVRDFDSKTSYADWADRFPGLASRLPMSRTSRGIHAYFRTSPAVIRRLSSTGGSIISGSGHAGELRAGGLAVLPSSIHPSGRPYRWIREPGDIPRIDDPQACGLVPESARLRALSRTESQEPLEGPPTTEDLYPTEPHPPIPCVTPPGGDTEYLVGVAISTTQPAGVGERHRKLFDLARALKSIPELRDADPETLKPIVLKWWRQAWPNIRTKDWATSWSRFRNAWRDARRPKWSTVSGLTSQASGTGADRLAAICAILQGIAGDKPFFLDCRTAGRLLGVSHKSAWKHLKRLQQARRLELVRPGNRRERRASEYMYRR